MDSQYGCECSQNVSADSQNISVDSDDEVQA